MVVLAGVRRVMAEVALDDMLHSEYQLCSGIVMGAELHLYLQDSKNWIYCNEVVVYT